MTNKKKEVATKKRNVRAAPKKGLTSNVGKKTKKTPVKKEMSKTDQKKTPQKKRAKKKSLSANKAPLKCIIRTKVNFIKMSDSLTAATIRPHLNNLETKKHDTRGHQIVDTIHNLKSLRAFNPGEKNRWKDILQVEGSTSLIGIKTAPATLKIALFSAMYMIYEDLFAIRGQSQSSKPKVVQEEDIETYFSELKPIKYGLSYLIPWDDIDTSVKKKIDSNEDSKEDQSKPEKDKNGKSPKSDKAAKNPKSTETEKSEEKIQPKKRKIDVSDKKSDKENENEDEASEPERKTKRTKR